MTDEQKTLNRFCNRHGLAPYQRRIVGMLMDGLNNREIARETGTSVGTIDNFVHRVYQKTGIRSRLKLVVHLYKEVGN